MSKPGKAGSRRLGFWRDRRGVAALEFALVAPALIAFYLGTAELTEAIMANRRNAHVTSAIGDLVAQSSQVSDSDLTDIFSIGEIILAPFPTASLKMRVTSVSTDANGVARVDWSNGSGMTGLGAGTTITLPVGLVGNNESVIMSESSYTFDSPLDKMIPNALNFSEKLYLKPRRSSKVMKS